tara:strand:+ start:3421 stop:4059 length:639 start_codon:yes stop_codon:yes gene_type:complete
MTTTYTITQSTRVDGYGVLQSLEPLANIPLGSTIDVAGTSRGFNGTGLVVYSLTEYELVDVTTEGEFVFDYQVYRPNQVIFPSAGDDLAYAVDAGTITWEPQASWTSVAACQEFLGIASATVNDTAFLTTCVNAANVFAYRRRVEAGYHDDTAAAPNAAVALGTTLYASALYRERGSVDSFASFDSFNNGAQPFGSMARIMQLLGINRPQVG